MNGVMSRSKTTPLGKESFANLGFEVTPSFVDLIIPCVEETAAITQLIYA
jgi:hypothetical protein